MFKIADSRQDPSLLPRLTTPTTTPRRQTPLAPVRQSTCYSSPHHRACQLHETSLTMPTYYALGLSATLSVLNLEPSLSKVVELRQGKDQKQDALRIQETFATALNLLERPIGSDGGCKGIQQFIGTNDDLPFYMVEAGAWLQQSNLEPRAPPLTNQPEAQSQTTSSLTSLPTSFQTLRAPSENALTNTSPPDFSFTANPNTSAFSGFENARDYLDQPSAQQALCLTIDLPLAAFLPSDTRSKTNIKDLLIEVWLNGQLANVTYINKRAAQALAPESKINKVLFGGTRIHRQIEKPWIYEAHPADDEASGPAENRWNTVSEYLRQEVERRGRNKWDDLSPSSEFLRALAKISIPDRMKEKNNLGIIDVIVTAGQGRKYGPEKKYLLQPMCMDDRDFRRPTTVLGERDLIHEDDGLAFETENKIELSADESKGSHASSSPAIPLLQQSATSAVLPETSVQQKAGSALSDSRNTDFWNLSVTVHNRYGKSSRTLGKRLADIRMMGENSRRAALMNLREELGEETFSKVKELYDIDKTWPELSPLKMSETLSHIGETHDSFMMEKDDGLIDKSNTDDLVPSGMMPPALGSTSTDPAALLTQRRMDMALDSGVSPDGALYRQLAGKKSQNTQPRNNRASVLADSPTKQPVKRQRRRIKITPRKAQSETTALKNITPKRLPLQTVLSEVQSGSISKSKSRSKRGWNASEITPAQALETFRTPDICKGSVVSYAGEGIQRQIGKARNGEFKEETLVVGMRFVVV
ncbi:Hypothetical protein R9X50_00790600 [Acrodontium crateriforme]|uniref:Uncharacterized protein n=1 Tax=Acrodontium crateriforme TaxID=150365 RepID=A0AAQ3RED0_9PEZI|nr:Hypothetical protein R9X50_00790600 [Acrodontium crateriforme]